MSGLIVTLSVYLNFKLIEIGMSYIILEMHGGPQYAVIVTDTDGNNLVFDAIGEAEKEAEDCQDALIIDV